MADTKPSTSPAASAEEQMLAAWNNENTFQKSIQNRAGKPVFSFYDGPPFANGLPHFGHSLVTSIKDSLGRYKTMQGFYVERRNGWDTHGLPVEFAIEKQFGVSGKKQILELGLDKFNAACRESVFTYKGEWEGFFDRIGRWTDSEHAYVTMDRNYTESVWWVMQQVHQKGLLYRGFKSMPYCPRCETPLSNFELNEGYKDDVSDPSLFVKFKLVDEDAFLLGWTTTPWSLPGNAAIAVRPEETYVYVQLNDDNGKSETVVLAKKRADDVLKNEQNYTVLKEIPAEELAGKQYEPLFQLADPAKYENSQNLYHVWLADIVSIDDGTGVLHVAPAFGEEDLKLGETNKFPLLSSLNHSGRMNKGFGVDQLADMFFKDADREVIELLTQHGNVFAAETFQHTYPFCYRCDSPLFYYAISTWFVRVSAIKKELLQTAQEISWTPEHIKEGRFGKWLAGARDWAISRNRYWGAPMPIWVNVDDPNDYMVIGSIEELQKLAPEADLSDLHRPFIDNITFTKDGKTYKRIEEVIDCWFESGSMPVAQQHYPFENKEKFDQSFPADYIGEGLDQTRLWFYVQHVISTILFDRPAYKHVLVNGMIMAADGQKLSKRLKNYPPLDDVFSHEGADALRLYLLSNNQAVNADYMRFNRDGMKDLQRNVLGTLQNSQRFFKMYAELDGWKPAPVSEEPTVTNPLDVWMLARLNETINEVTTNANSFSLAHAITPIFGLIDDMSNWYIRRSRRRFWKGEDDQDKQQAYAVLHFALVRTTQLLAPWAPFISDRLYRELTGGESVHLSDWPKASTVNSEALDQMKLVRSVIADGLKQRADAKVKVRQPLASVAVSGAPDFLRTNTDTQTIICEELNVKTIEFADGKDLQTVLNTELTDELRAEGLMRDIVRHVQNLRKSSGLQVEDRIVLHLSSNDEQAQNVVVTFGDVIKQETLATELTTVPVGPETEIKVGDVTLTASLRKA
ncbi:MAG TPA: isoleucine--tRNA ligase [Candidatus Saccharimonadales bacterium]|nr:isoleucine--tRNA ligase [Candidatus Saccharimonadales bacterium]